jgi:hypothetical protein
MLLGEWVAQWQLGLELVTVLRPCRSRTTSIESLADLPTLGEDVPVVLGDRLAPSM